jgi:ketosteroid isomerase-like protein
MKFLRFILLSIAVSAIDFAQPVLSASTQQTPGGRKLVITLPGPPASLASTVANAPYSAEQISERTRLLAGGTRIKENAGIAQMFRDSAGRRRMEYTILEGPHGEEGVRLVTIRDYVAEYEYLLDPTHHIAHRMKFGPGAVGGPNLNPVRLALDQYTRPPDSGRAGSRVVQSLGRRTIEGLLCDGTRETTTVPADAEGNDGPLVSTLDRWYARDLRLLILSRLKDPRDGEVVTRMINIHLDEPAPVLFQVQSDYAIKDETDRFTIEIARPRVSKDEEAVRTLIHQFAMARNAHDGKTAAKTYDSGAEYIFINGASLKGTAALEKLWGNIEGQMIRTVTRVDFPTSRIAIARVTADYTGATGESSLDETFVVAKDAAGQWKIQIHQGMRADAQNR